MSFIKKIAFISCAVMMISSCEQHPTSYSYLVRHPDFLKQEVAKCQNGQNDSASQTVYCQTVMLAATNFMAMLNDWQSDQEGFGAKVLAAQTDCIKAKAGIRSARAELHALQEKHADAESIKIAQDKLGMAEKDSEEKRHVLQTMYGVISLSTPE